MINVMKDHKYYKFITKMICGHEQYAYNTIKNRIKNSIKSQ